MKLTAFMDGEVGDMWKVSYALIDRGDGARCAWCEKKVDEIGEAFIDEHIDKHVEDDKVELSTDKQ